MLHVSLDGADAATHDAFRGVPGTFDRATAILDTLRDLQLPVQVGTTITKHNIDQLEQMASHGINVWNVFFLVPTGRGRQDAMIDVATAEAS
jgi:MoaA/NifB/PqqE/SkfB family radical SAM enzyme